MRPIIKEMAVMAAMVTQAAVENKAAGTAAIRAIATSNGTLAKALGTVKPV